MESTEYYRAFNSLLVECTSLIIQSNEENFSERLDSVLSKIGSFSGVDRAYYFEFSESKLTASNTNEWCKEGVDPQIDYLQDLPCEIFPNWIQTMIAGGEIYIDDLERLPAHWAPEREILEPQGIKSLLSIPVRESEVLYGFIGFDAVDQFVEWKDDSRHLLRILADNIGSVVRRNLQNKELVLKTTMANSANKAKSEFLANMSHELRTPLNGVIGFGDLLKSTKLDGLQGQYVRHLNESALTLMELINQILDFSKIEAEKMKLVKEKVDLLKLLENAVVLVRQSAIQKKISLEFDFDKTLLLDIEADPVRLRQVVVNLLSNAVKFTHEGKVLLRVVKMGELDGNVTLKIEIADTGIGIAEDQKQFLFTAFGQADASTTKKYGGSGLGLVISNNLLEMMGSTITLESELGKGSVFSFELQCKELGKRFVTEFSSEGSHRLVDVLTRNQSFADQVKRYGGWNGLEINTYSTKEEWMMAAMVRKEESLLVVNDDDNEGFGLSFVQQLRTSELDVVSQLPVLFCHSREDGVSHETLSQLNRLHTLLLPLLPSDFFSGLAHLSDQERETEVKGNDEVVKKSIEMQPDKQTILIVEDNELNLILLKALVHQLRPKATIIEARSGREALDMVAQSPSLILMDIQMAGMDGRETTEQLRKVYQITTPIVACTAHAITGEKEKCLAAGMDDFIAKPIAKDIVKLILDKYLA
ncbi:MAG: ATP-binding protein [Bacteroidota bacterium]